MKIEIEKHKTNRKKLRKISNSEEAYKLKEVQEIKNAIQEHFLLIGLDRANNVRNVTVGGIGTTGYINIDLKLLLRTALINAYDKVLFVHNHPSYSLKISNEDRNITQIAYAMFESFNIQLVDHIIVTNVGYTSIFSKESNKIYEESDKVKTINNSLIIEENRTLKNEIEKLKEQLLKNNNCHTTGDNNENKEIEEECL